jgi:hypothetical protein
MQVNYKKSHTLIDNKSQGTQSHLRIHCQEESRRRSVLWGLILCNQQIDLAGQIPNNIGITVACKKSHTLIDNKGQGTQSYLRTHCQEEKPKAIRPTWYVLLGVLLRWSIQVSNKPNFFGKAFTQISNLR